jgi:hypothetical protein
LQTQYLTIRDKARDARQALVGLRARDAQLRGTLQAKAAEQDAAAADALMAGFKLRLDAARPIVEAIGAEAKRIRSLRADLTNTVMQLINELKSVLWI